MAPSGIRNDGTTVSPQTGQSTSGTSGGTTATVPLRRNLFQGAGMSPSSGKTATRTVVADTLAARSSGSDDLTVNLTSPGGQRRTLQQIADSQGMTVAQLLAAPSNSNLRKLYESQIQLMMDKYRTYEHQLKRTTSQVETQVANDLSWIPTDTNVVHVPSRRAPDSPERLLDDKAIDKTEIENLVSKVPDAKYQGVVRKAMEMAGQAEGAGEDSPDLKEIYSQGQDHLPLDAKLVSFIYGQQGLKLKAQNTWSVASISQTMYGGPDLRITDPKTLSSDAIKPGMVVTSREKSRLDIAVTGIQQTEKGRGIFVICADRSQKPDSKPMTYEFRSLDDIEKAGYPGTIGAGDPLGEKLVGPSSGKKGRTDVAGRV